MDGTAKLETTRVMDDKLIMVMVTIAAHQGVKETTITVSTAGPTPAAGQTMAMNACLMMSARQTYAKPNGRPEEKIVVVRKASRKDA